MSASPVRCRGDKTWPGEAWNVDSVAVASAERSAASSEVLEEEDKGGGGGLGRGPVSWAGVARGWASFYFLFSLSFTFCFLFSLIFFAPNK